MLFWPWTDVSQKINDALKKDFTKNNYTCNCEGGCEVNKYTTLRWAIMRLLVRATWAIYTPIQKLFGKFKKSKPALDFKTIATYNTNLTEMLPYVDEMYKNSEKVRNKILEDLKKNNVDLSFLDDNIKK